WSALCWPASPSRTGSMPSACASRPRCYWPGAPAPPSGTTTGGEVETREAYDGRKVPRLSDDEVKTRMHGWNNPRWVPLAIALALAACSHRQQRPPDLAP